MRKIKKKNKENIERDTAVESIMYLTSKIACGFAKLLSWKNDDVYNNLNVISKLARSKNKIIFDEKIAFNDYKTSEIIKLFYKLPFTLIYEKEKLSELIVSDNHFIKIAYDDTVIKLKKYLEKYYISDCTDIKVMFFNFFDIVAAGQLLEALLEKYNLLDKQYKTFFTKCKNWSTKIQCDIMNVTLDELEDLINKRDIA